MCNEGMVQKVSNLQQTNGTTLVQGYKRRARTSKQQAHGILGVWRIRGAKKYAIYNRLSGHFFVQENKCQGRSTKYRKHTESLICGEYVAQKGKQSTTCWKIEDKQRIAKHQAHGILGV